MTIRYPMHGQFVCGLCYVACLFEVDPPRKGVVDLGKWSMPGVMGFSPELRPLADAVASLASETYSCVSAPIQWAALQAFEPDL